MKYATGAYCIFSNSTTGVPCLIIQNGTSDLSRYSSHTRGINSLHALHTSAHEIKAVSRRFRIAFVCVGVVFYPLRAVMLTLTSCMICSPISDIIVCALYLCLGLIQISAFATVSSATAPAFAVFSLMCTSVFMLVLSLLTSWFFISMVALVGMELLCLVSAMTNPEVGLILYDNVDERRYKLGAAAGFLEECPGFIVQAYYTHLMGVGGTVGTSRAISLALSSWRMFVLTVKRFIKLKMIARDRRRLQATTSQSWDKEQEILKNSNGVARNILFNFCSFLLPDAFSAVLRVCIFSMYAGFLGWLVSQNMYTKSGFSALLDSNFPVLTNICPRRSTFSSCDFNAQCQRGECECNLAMVEMD